MTTPTTYAQASTSTDLATYRAGTLATLANPPAPLQPAPVAGWSPRAPQRILVEDFAAQMSIESGIRALIAQTISPQTAALAGPDWVAAVIGWFKEVFIPALPAVWLVPFQCAPAAAPVTVDASSTIQIQSTDGRIFLCTQATAVVFNSGGSYQGTLQFAARALGVAGDSTASNILAGKVLTGPAGLSIGPGTPTRVTAGRDVETPAQAIQRCLGKWSTLGAGWTDQSFDYLIPLFAPTVTRWFVDSANPFGPGTTGVYLANSAGPASGTEVTEAQTGLGARATRPNGSGQAVVLPVTAYPDIVTVIVEGDGTNLSLAADITAALLSLTAQLPLGPIYITNEFLVDVCLGKAFSGLTTFQTGVGTYAALPLALPGFGGAVGVTALTTSQGLATVSGILHADVVPTGQVLVMGAPSVVTVA